MILILPRIYTNVEISMPRIVARDTVFSECSVLPAGMVAHSKPTKANMVMVAVTVIAEKVGFPLKLKGWKFCIFIKNSPPRDINSNGSNFKMVVIN